MGTKKYKLRILPLFEKDLIRIVDYISFRLENPIAAHALVDSVEAAISKRLDAPESFEPYKSFKDRKYSYYRIYVKNYIVFYVVIDDIMEVRRILYNKKNIKREI